MKAFAACASVVLAACTASAPAAPRDRPEPPRPNAPAAANATYAYYDVTGATAVELFTSMRRQASSIWSSGTVRLRRI